ncbi:MAG: PIN domain-containing protein [Candidatus Verstraetearchaeota archaeon]|jgi:rRNA-processing protein FCF1|nr:PIN domain-containing protein [Candidatus Verstraetearchaeota archaeon]
MVLYDKPVLLDTNIIIYAVSEPFDLISQLRELGFSNIIIIESIKKELEKLLTKGNNKERKFAKLALDLCKKFKIEKDPPVAGSIDDKIIHIAKDKGYIVATSDFLLRKRLKELGLTTIYLKDKRLQLD